MGGLQADGFEGSGIWRDIGILIACDFFARGSGAEMLECDDGGVSRFLCCIFWRQMGNLCTVPRL